MSTTVGASAEIGRLVLASVLALTLGTLLFFLAPSLVHTPAASAQGIVTCPNGQIVAPGIPCPLTGQTQCPGSGIVVSPGAACPVSCPNGQFVNTTGQCSATRGGRRSDRLSRWRAGAGRSGLPRRTIRNLFRFGGRGPSRRSMPDRLPGRTTRSGGPALHGQRHATPERRPVQGPA